VKQFYYRFKEIRLFVEKANKRIEEVYDKERINNVASE